ncbi:hypothetical protein [Algoriphagus boritolerans]|uniref:hypothetical protein n=1 Tax=Algoriphagus boritolerans TaxID=308111 RepID=UPI000AD3EBF6
MRPVFLFLIVFFVVLQTEAQTYSIVDSRAIKLFQEGEDLTLSRQYDQAIEKYQAAIAREGSFLEAYVKASQLMITQGKLKEAEEIALTGKGKLSGKNATAKHVADFGWLFSNLYLKQGKFTEAYRQFQEVDPLFDAAFKKSMYYNEMKVQMDFLGQELGDVRSIAKEKLESPLNEFQLQYFPVLTADGEQILFTKRDGTGNFDKEDIFTAYLDENGNWTKPQSLAQTINSPFNEGTCSVTADGKILIYTSCDAPDSQGSCDLYIAYKMNGDWQRPTNMGTRVNSRSWDSQPHSRQMVGFCFFLQIEGVDMEEMIFGTLSGKMTDRGQMPKISEV